MGSSAEVKYAAFEEKVKRTVFLDNLSPVVTESVLRNTFGQFGSVQNVQFIPDYATLRKIPCCALVEMEKSSEAEAIVSELAQNLYLIAGTPRPTRARPAEVEMFDDRPPKPGRRMQFIWCSDFELGNKMRRVVEKHAAEASILLDKQLKLEEELDRKQDKYLKRTCKKYQVVKDVVSDKTAPDLADQYKIQLSDD